MQLTENDQSSHETSINDSWDSVDLFCKHPHPPPEPEECYDCGSAKEVVLPRASKSYSKPLTKVQPTWRVNRKQSLVQWLERHPIKKKCASSTQLYSPKKSGRKRLTQMNKEEEITLSDDSLSKRRRLKQLRNAFQLPSHQLSGGDASTKTQTFPFKTTASGNYKLQPSQVVYESKNLSIVAADPGSITLNVADSSKSLVGTTAKKDDYMTTCLFTALGGTGLVPFGSEFSDTDASEGGILLNGEAAGRALEVNLSKMGYTVDNDIEWKKFNLPAKSDLQKLLLNHIINVMNPDMQIKILDKTFNCHRIVLQCYCPYFTHKTGPQVELPECSVKKEAFSVIYQWMLYQGPDSYRILRRDTILDVFKASQFLGVKELEDQCWAFIDNVDLFNEDKAFLLYLEARKHGNKDIMELMVPRVQRFFLTLVSSKEFVEFSCEEVCTFLRSNYICIHCEMEVFLSAVRWLSHDWPRRKPQIPAVMGCVRFGLIDPITLLYLIRNPQSPEYLHIAGVPQVAKMIEDGLAFTMLKIKCQDDSTQEQFETLKVPKPVPRNWAGIDRQYASYKEFLRDLSYYRSKHRLDVKQSKMQVQLENVSKDDFFSFAVLPTTIEQRLKEISHGQSKLYKTVKLDAKDLKQLKGIQSQDERSPYKGHSKDIKSRLCSIAEDQYKKKVEGNSNKSGKQISPEEKDLAARKIQAAYRVYSSRKLRAGADNCERSSGILTRSRSDPSLPTHSAQPLSCPRKQINILPGKNTVFVFGGTNPFDENSTSRSGSTVYQYVRGSNVWRKCGEMPEPRHYHCVLYHQGKVYVAGGKHPKRHPLEHEAISRKVWCFDPAYHGWSRLKDMPHARRGFSLVALNNHLYAIGGMTEDDKVTANVDRYSVENNKWSRVKPLTTARSGVSACEYQGRIWVAGGMDGNNIPSDVVEFYSARRNKWVQFSTLRFSVAYSVIVPAVETVYLVGGVIGFPNHPPEGSGRHVDVWDPKAHEWNLATTMRKPRHAHAAVYLEQEADANPGMMFILGGMMTKYNCVTEEVECWQLDDNSHVNAASLPHGMAGLAAVVMPTDTMG